MPVLVMDATGATVQVATNDDVMAAGLNVRPAKTKGQVFWSRGVLTFNGASQQLVPANANRTGLVIQNRTGNGAIDFDPAGNALTVGAGWLVLGGDPPVALLGAECPVGIVTVIGVAGQTITYWELT